MSFADMGWKMRLALVVSALWLLLVFAIARSERDSGAVFVGLGLIPVAILWGIAWVVRGYLKQRATKQLIATDAPAQKHPTDAPPDISQTNSAGRDDILSLPLATRWPRFFARMFDTWWEVMLVAFVLSFVLARYSAEYLEWLARPGSAMFFGLLCLPVALVLDAVLYRIFGNTPGKALLGLRVTSLRGQPLTFAEFAGRNLNLWMSGLALGIPIVILFTCAMQSRRLGLGQPATYDERPAYRVYAEPAGWLRATALVGSFLGLFVIYGYLKTLEMDADAKASHLASAKPYYWENPITKRTASISPKWKHTVQQNADGQSVYLFTEQLDRALVIFANETMDRLTLQDYVKALQTGNVKNMQFSDGGRFTARDGKQVWDGSGTMLTGDTNRLHVQVVKDGGTFWRVVTVQMLPYEYSSAAVGELQGALWKTALSQ
jgi:uncharacterized RDD family membrane protein YckC